MNAVQETQYEMVLDRLKGVRRSGDRATSLCPAHEDRSSSLSIGIGANGNVVAKCFAGCPFSEIVEACGLKMSDFFVPRETPSNGHHLTLESFAQVKGFPLDFLRSHGVSDEGNWIKITYRLRDGTLAPRQRRRSAIKAGDGSTWLGPPGQALVPYGLWRLDMAMELGSLLLVEGETDVLAAWLHNVPALGFPGADNVKILEADMLDGVRILWLIREPDAGGEKFVAGLGKRLAAIGWQGRAYSVSLEKAKDIHALHALDPDLFAENLAAAKANAVLLGAPTATAAESEPVIVRLADVVAEEVSWLWPGRFAYGKLSLLTGNPGEGKSMCTMDMAARITTGGAWPASFDRAPESPVVILSAEDGIADTIRPRIDAAGGDPSQVYVLTAVRIKGAENPFNLARDLPMLAVALESTRAKVVFIDPITAYLGETDSYKDSEVRGVLAPLADLAARTSSAVIAVAHLNKDAQRRMIYRTGGSIGFVAAARSVVVIGADPGDESGKRRLFVSVKNNLAPRSDALAFSIGDGRVVWEESAIPGNDADALLGTSTPPESQQIKSEKEEAKDFLVTFLGDHMGRASYGEILKAAKEAGVSEKTLRRAKAELGVKSVKESLGGAWAWVRVL